MGESSVKKNGVRRRFSVIFIVASLLAIGAMAWADPSVKVSDQPYVNDSVTVTEVVSDGPGWMVIHADGGGRPGPVIGYAAVPDGTSTDVVVNVNQTAATTVLYAMLHIDAEAVGTYEFPGADVPVMFNGMMVSPSFTVSYPDSMSY
jgi:hypothetical protein